MINKPKKQRLGKGLHETLSARVADGLRKDILDGTLPVGGNVPTEKQLAHRFGTNRNTVREALRALQAQDLIAVSQGQRATVRDFRRHGELSLLPSFLRYTRDPQTFAETVREMLA